MHILFKLSVREYYWTWKRELYVRFFVGMTIAAMNWHYFDIDMHDSECYAMAWGRAAISREAIPSHHLGMSAFFFFSFQLTLPLQSVAFRSSGEISSVKMLARTWRMISSSWFRDARNSVVINGIFCIFILRFSREIRPLIVFTTQLMLRTRKIDEMSWMNLN